MTLHPYQRDPQSGAGNCTCGHPERAWRHPHRFTHAAIIGMEIHGDVGHTCYDDGELTCVVAKLLLSPNGPDWQTLTAKTPRGLR